DRLAEVLEDAPHLLVGDVGRWTADLEPAHLGERDDRAHVDGRRVSERLPGCQSSGVDVGISDHIETMRLDGTAKRVADQTAQHLSSDLGPEHAVEDGTGCPARTKTRQASAIAEQ